jgi:hypothetical protein
VFVLTHEEPHDEEPDDLVPVWRRQGAVATALDAAEGKNIVVIIEADVAQQCVGACRGDSRPPRALVLGGWLIGARSDGPG